jgi:predicted permease
MPALLLDVRYAIRGFVRAKAATAVLVVSLALGTGANAALYSTIRALLFQPPAGVAEPSGLVTLHTTQFNGSPRGASSYPDYLSIKSFSRSVDSLAAFDDSRIERVGLDTALQRVRIVTVTDEFFPTLALTPSAGRLLGPGDMTAQDPPAVISHELWSMFGQPADAVGRPVHIRGRDYRIVGIAPARFDGLQLGRACHVWIPIDVVSTPPTLSTAARGDRRFSLIGRLAPGASLGRAQQEIDAISRKLAGEYPSTNRGTRISADDPRLMTIARYRRMDASDRTQVTLVAAAVLGATGLLLVSACVNAASLLISRSAARRRELAVKLALGASRSTLARQALVESLLLSLGGAILGLLFAYWIADGLPAFFAPEEAEMLDTRLGAPVVFAVIALAVAAGACFAIAPARAAVRTLDVEALRGDAGGVSERGPGTSIRAFVVTGQVALSTVMLIAAGLLVRALDVALEGDLGPGGRGVAIVLLRMPGDAAGDVVRGIRFRDRVLDDVLRIPGAEAAGWIATLPVGRATNNRFEMEVAPGVTEAFDADINVASSGYFQTMQIPLIEGRTFTPADRALAPPVVVVDDVFARRHFGGSAVGRRMTDEAGVTYEIVGVVRGGKYRTFQETPEPMAYFPVAQRQASYLHVVVRTSQEAAPLLPLVADRLRALDDAVDVRLSTTFDAHLAEALSLDRLATTVVAACGIVALILATIGVYGVIIDGVRRRTPEIGLRVALGAGALHVVRLVFGEGLHLTVTGAAAGAVGAVVLARVVRVFVHGLPGVDLMTLAVAPLALAVVVVAAAALPTRRALRINPTVALRADP